MTMTNDVEILKVADFYRTADLALAAVISLSVPIEALDRQGGRGKAHFLFRRNEQLDLLVERFWRGELRVEPQAYFAALRNIKARLYGDD